MDEDWTDLSNPSGPALRDPIAQPTRARWQAATVAVIWVATAAAVVISLVTAQSGSAANNLIGAVGQGIPALMLVSVGAVLIGRLAGSLIGWLLAAGGFVIAVSTAVSGLADYEPDEPDRTGQNAGVSVQTVRPRVHRARGAGGST